MKPGLEDRRRVQVPKANWNVTCSSVLIFLIIGQLSRSVNADCRVEFCSRRYQAQLKGGQIKRGATPQFCTVLRAYFSCLKATGKACRGNLHYHTLSSLADQWINEFRCDDVAEADEQVKGVEPTLPVHMNEVAQVCHWEGGDQSVFCSVFGDPHVLTFGGEFQTCSSIGAWPLVDNQYLAVSVTNEPLVPGSPASAITKITVILKSTSDCSPERTYEAYVDSLPNSFVDGSEAGGEGDIVQIIEHDPGRFVEITARHLAIIIYIRQIGRHLSIAFKMPKELLETTAEGLHLCVRGCPSSERLDQKRNDVYRLPREAAYAVCRDYNVTDAFLDACVFDVSTTNEVMFTSVAKYAQGDYIQLNSESDEILKGRTALLPQSRTKVDRDVAQSSVEQSGPGRPLVLLTLASIVMLLSNIGCICSVDI